MLVRVFGDKALKYWGIVFLPLLASRPILILCAGLADAGSLSGNRFWQIVVGALLLLPAIYGMHSVLKYFTINRALGGDHFFDEYANMPMVSQGIFKYSSNAMYSFIFLGLWGIALLTGSWNALVLALFNHAYISAVSMARGRVLAYRTVAPGFSPSIHRSWSAAACCLPRSLRPVQLLIPPSTRFTVTTDSPCRTRSNRVSVIVSPDRSTNTLLVCFTLATVQRCPSLD